MIYAMESCLKAPISGSLTVVWLCYFKWLLSWNQFVKTKRGAGGECAQRLLYQTQLSSTGPVSGTAGTQIVKP